jgi:Zn-dependent alcohol dehydrogenase
LPKATAWIEPMKNRAAVIQEPSSPFAIEELELAPLRSDEVLVRIAGVGVCHTDLICRDQVYPVPFPIVLGHEGSGIIEQVGPDVGDLKQGDAVVLSYRSCGECINCKRDDGSASLSKGGDTVHGHFFGQSSFAEYAIAHVSNTVKVPDGINVPLQNLGPLGCGIQTGAGAVMNTLKP